jgi:hypothetical protein
MLKMLCKRPCACTGMISMVQANITGNAIGDKAARFPAYKDLAGFDVASSEVNEALVRQLHRGEFTNGADYVVALEQHPPSLNRSDATAADKVARRINV